MSETFTPGRVTSHPVHRHRAAVMDWSTFHEQNDAFGTDDIAMSATGLNATRTAQSCADRCVSATSVQASAWHEHCGPNACADGANRADRPFFRIGNAYVHGRIVTRPCDNQFCIHYCIHMRDVSNHAPVEDAQEAKTATRRRRRPRPNPAHDLGTTQDVNQETAQHNIHRESTQEDTETQRSEDGRDAEAAENCI